VNFIGALNEGVTATDLVLTVTELLRKKGVVGKFVEYSGDGLDHLSLEDQATLGNMSPEYGATCGFFPIDDDTLKYLRATGREDEHMELVEAYARAQGMWRETGTAVPRFTDVVELDLSTVEPSLAGPRRPQDRVPLSHAHTAFRTALAEMRGVNGGGAVSDMYEEGGGSIVPLQKSAPVEGANYELTDGDVVIAAITSCTNTSNPNVLIGAGLLARNAREKGIHTKPWVKTSFAPGSQVVTDYLEKAGLQDDLDAMGFNLVGYGCTTCIGNSGPLDEPISKAIHENDLVASAVLSGNRNFEGRINPDVRANYLASPPLVVAYALAGSLNVNISAEPIDKNDSGEAVYLKDIWPSTKEIAEIVRTTITPEMFKTRYADVFKGDEHWQRLSAAEISVTYNWSDDSTYVQRPPFFDGMAAEPKPVTDIEGARILGLFGDSITTDHISPAGAIPRQSPAGEYLVSRGVEHRDFNSFGARRGNHEVMMRGTFGNIRIKNQMVPGVEGGYTIHYPSGEQLAIYDAAMRYADEGVPLVVFAGKEYGTGSSRDWAAKGTRLLGVRAVIAESFERIHRSNLIGMGVLPAVFADGSWQDAGIRGDEVVTIRGLDALKPGAELTAEVTFADGSTRELPLICRIDTDDELAYYRNGGILHYVLRRLAA
ncbi:MAG: aconitate hydratase AcnA, partial [Dichotomicrobium sp.]